MAVILQFAVTLDVACCSQLTVVLCENPTRSPGCPRYSLATCVIVQSVTLFPMSCRSIVLLVGLSRVPIATALALMSVNWQWLTLLPCEPCEKPIAFDPRRRNVHPVKLTFFEDLNCRAAGVSRACPGPVALP